MPTDKYSPPSLVRNALLVNLLVSNGNAKSAKIINRNIKTLEEIGNANARLISRKLGRMTVLLKLTTMS